MKVTNEYVLELQQLNRRISWLFFVIAGCKTETIQWKKCVNICKKK